ncbi:hypothetical protein [Dactylosporangium sp. CA-092794]|uniref:hypothetical protein n=1 Tax=Dactylosporangium sp. CA-092794 TaxID=3239929 RepID=UPI003D94D03F
MRTDVERDAAPATGDDAAADGAVHGLLLRLAGHLPDRLLADARDRLAGGRRAEAARMVAFEALAQPLPLAPDEEDLLRAELTADPSGHDLAAALAEVRGERDPGPWLFQPATARAGGDPVVARPLDLTGAAPDDLDPVDRALVAFARATPGVRAVWRAWRMPAGSHAWHPPVRVAALAVAHTTGGLPAIEAGARAAMARAGDAAGQAEVCPAGLDSPYYQTLARCCGALLWAADPPQPITVAPVFDGADPDRGPWFAPGRPVVAASGERDRLLAALRAAPVVIWTSTPMVDVFAPQRGAVVPRHLRSDGRWVWTEAAAYYLEHYGLVPHPQLVAHLNRPGPRPPDEVALHRVMVLMFRHGPDSAAWYLPGPVVAPA